MRLSGRYRFARPCRKTKLARCGNHLRTANHEQLRHRGKNCDREPKCGGKKQAPFPRFRLRYRKCRYADGHQCIDEPQHGSRRVVGESTEARKTRSGEIRRNRNSAGSAKRCRSRSPSDTAHNRLPKNRVGNRKRHERLHDARKQMLNEQAQPCAGDAPIKPIAAAWSR